MVDDFFQDDSQALAERLDHALPPASVQIDEVSLRGSEYDDDPLIEVARMVARGPHPALPDAALERIESRLRTRHAALHARPSSFRPSAHRNNHRSRWQMVQRGLRSIAAVLVVLVMFSGSLSVLSANALPGDDMYPVKTIIEELQLILVSDDHEPGLRVRLAERRLDEFEKLLKTRETVYPDVLMESSAQLNRALTLLALGHGNRTKLDPRVANVSYRQAALIQYAAPLAPPETYASLSLVADWNNLLLARVLGEGTLDYGGSVVSSVHKTNFWLPDAGLIPPTRTPDPDATLDEQSRVPALVLNICGG